MTNELQTDDEALRETLSEQLAHDGEFAPVQAGTAAEALARLATEEARYDAIILDLYEGPHAAQRRRDRIEPGRSHRDRAGAGAIQRRPSPARARHAGRDGFGQR